MRFPLMTVMGWRERAGGQSRMAGKRQVGTGKWPDWELGSISIMVTSQARLFTFESMPICMQDKEPRR